MSTQIGAYYPQIPAQKAYQTVTFGGANLDPELNVFSLDSTTVTNTTSFVFNVPKGSFVIVNVSGNPNFTNAGFSGPNGSSLPTSRNRILWNFPNTTSLTLWAVSFPGSILAPKAGASFSGGSLSGTAVVKSAISSAELYMTPYQIPSAGGCLWSDSSWSCSNDTTLDDTGNAANLAPESGFLEIEGGNYIAEGVSRTSPTHRIWYDFQPAQATPTSRALAVFFNGGPGSPTSGLMFAFNTATQTLDPNAIAGSNNNVITYNTNAWTKFANLLYIDAPATGFSYPLPLPDGGKPSIGNDMDRDAGIFIQVVLKFLARHPGLQSNPVILVAESYGGVRATLMLKYLYDSAHLQPGPGGGAYQDQELYGVIENYFNTVLGTSAPTSARLATKFGSQVLIDPGLVGWHQEEQFDGYLSNSNPNAPANTNCLPQLVSCSNCPKYCYQLGVSPTVWPTCDPYNCDKSNSQWPNNWQWGRDQQETTAANNLNVVANLNQALGIDATTIAWMQAANRQSAYGRGALFNSAFSTLSMQNAFDGTTKLNGDDNYYVLLNNQVNSGYYTLSGTPPVYTTSNHARQWDDMSPRYPSDCGLATGVDFINNLRNGVATMITAATYDATIWSPSIAAALGDGSFKAVTLGAGYQKTYATDLTSRPGAMGIDSVSGLPQIVVPMPTYNSGHTVVMRDPASLLADVIQWYSDSPHSGPPYAHH
jgi:hypothetical protein